MEIGLRQVGFDFYPSNIAAKLRKRDFELDRTCDVVVHMRADPVTLLLIELGFDHRILRSIGTGSTRPGELGGDAVNLHGSLGGDPRCIHSEGQLAIRNVDAIEGILQAGIFDDRLIHDGFGTGFSSESRLRSS